MPIGLEVFSKAATKLGDSAEIHARTDKQEKVATSRWQRFKVAFFGFFKGKSQIANENKAIRQSFFASIKQKYGQGLANLAAKDISSSENAGKPLTARVIRDTLDRVEVLGGKNWLVNQKYALNLSMNVVAAGVTANVPNSFSAVLKAGSELAFQQAGNLPDVLAQSLRRQYAMPSHFGVFRPGDLGESLGKLQTAVQTNITLRSKITDGVDLATPLGYRGLSATEARQCAVDSVHREIVIEMQNSVQRYLIDGDPKPDNGAPCAFDRHLAQVLQEKGLSPFRDLLDIAELKAAARTEVRGTGLPIDMDKADAAIRQTIERRLSRVADLPAHATAAAQLLVEANPAGSCRQEDAARVLTEQTLRLKAPMDREWVSGVARAQPVMQRLLDRLCEPDLPASGYLQAYKDLFQELKPLIHTMRPPGEWSSMDTKDFVEQAMKTQLALRPEVAAQARAVFKSEANHQVLGALATLADDTIMNPGKSKKMEKPLELFGNMARISADATTSALEQSGEPEAAIFEFIQTRPKFASPGEIPEALRHNARAHARELAEMDLVL